MEAVVRKRGNSPAVRLPASAIKEAAFSLEQKVNLTVTRGRIVGHVGPEYASRESSELQ